MSIFDRIGSMFSWLKKDGGVPSPTPPVQEAPQAVMPQEPESMPTVLENPAAAVATNLGAPNPEGSQVVPEIKLNTETPTAEALINKPVEVSSEIKPPTLGENINPAIKPPEGQKIA